MQAQRRRDTGPEIALRQRLHALGHRYRVAYPVPGLPRRTIDVAFPGRRLAVFVDGCFWHVCPEHATAPQANGGWWQAKLQGNVRRDRDTDSALADAGWEVVRVWEHTSAEEALEAVLNALRSSGVHHRRRASPRPGTRSPTVPR
jgi:DNA mismatch endonuclease (patch repair protein)